MLWGPFAMADGKPRFKYVVNMAPALGSVGSRSAAAYLMLDTMTRLQQRDAVNCPLAEHRLF